MTFRSLFRLLATPARVATAIAAVGLISATGIHASPREVRPTPVVTKPDTAVFAGGCFWGIEAVFEHLKGVTSAVSGYAGGTVESPSYEEVSSGTTGHAESVEVIYDAATISYAQLLEVFFKVAHDPTQLNRQGPDRGTQYRSAIFFRNPKQQQAATAYVAELGRAKVFSGPIVTQIAPLSAFYPAESYHQGYMALHPTQPYIVYNDAPKLVRLQQDFPALFQAR
ncbi:MAG: peptide-methionine (S)-S-oxide reductase MsrA [Gemmatimonadota bacterium]